MTCIVIHITNVDKCVELIIGEFSKETIHFTRFINYIDLINHIKKDNLEIKDIILEAIIMNPRGANTFVFTGFNDALTADIITSFEKNKKF